MRKLKRLIACLLTAAILAGLLAALPASAAGAGSFYDITDEVTANAAEVLRLLGVVNGTGGGAFRPAGTLTRAEFCKMTIEIMGLGGEEPAQRNRTIFQDVGPSHWARGYVNLASTTTLGGGEDKAGTRLIMGVGDGTFRPDRAITYGEAVTILMRVLGYGSGDVASGAYWYDGYVAVARSSGLSDGLSLSGSSTITRGQAALLFYNLLFTSPKGSTELYLKQLGGELTGSLVILSTDAVAEDGTTGSVMTSAGTYKTDHKGFDGSLNGTRGKLLLDRSQKLLAILPDEDSTFRTATIMGSPQANSIPLLGDETVSVKLTTAVYQSDSSEPTSYEKVWTGLRTGANLVLCYNGSGKLDYLYLRSSSDAVNEDNVLVAKNKPNGATNPFASLVTGSGDYQIYKNGVPAAVSDLQQYDVATYDGGSNTLFVSDLKLTGIYEDVYPNTAAPSTITVLGTPFTVLPSAVQDLSTFQVGDRLTLLLTSTGQVAGAVPTSVAKSNAVGVADVASKDNVTIELLDGVIKITGKTQYTEPAAQKLNGSLVTVSSAERGYLSLTKVQGKAAAAPLDLTKNTLGTKDLSAGIRFFEQVGNGKLAEIERSDIALTRIPAAQITYVGYDWAGRVDKVVLNDVTGDRYEYGLIYYQPAGMYDEKTWSTEQNDYVTTSTYRNGTIRVTNGSGEISYVVGSVAGAKSGYMGGIAGSMDQVDDHQMLAGFAALQSVTGLRRAQFDAEAMTLTTNSIILPISDQVQIYNEATKTWYTAKDGGHPENLQQALAFSDDLSVYYDKTPETGGKVRIIVIK